MGDRKGRVQTIRGRVQTVETLNRAFYLFDAVKKSDLGGGKSVDKRGTVVRLKKKGIEGGGGARHQNQKKA